MVTTPRTRSFRILVCVALILSLLTFNAAVSPGLTSVTVATAAPLSFDTATRARVNATYGRLPLYFEANQGQSDPQVRFLARGGGHTLFLTPTEAVLVLTKQDPSLQTVLRMTFMGASPQAQIMGQREVAGKANYFLGNDPAKWRTNVPTYAAVRYEGLYPGVDLVYYGNNQQLEYDLVVGPGADPSQIALSFKGADRLELDANGDLVLHTATGAIRQHKPVIYQDVGGHQVAIPGGYVLQGAHRVGFQVAAYDESRSLVIDPMILLYSTYLGGANAYGLDGDKSYGVFEGSSGVAVDTDRNAYVVGTTGSTDFPTTAGAFQTAPGGCCGSYDVFVAKLNPNGSGLVYSTYLGGSGWDGGAAIAVDSAGNAYVTGYAGSTDFPTTRGAFQTTFGGGADAFVTKLNPSGSGIVYSTYLGGRSYDGSRAIAVDADGNAYVTGATVSTDFPTTSGAFQIIHSIAYPPCDTDPLSWICLDAFVVKLNPGGSGLVYSTYLGGVGPDAGYGIAVDASGQAYVTGDSTSTDFPTTVGAFQTTSGGYADVFVTKLNQSGSGLVYSTYLGGGSNEGGSGIAVDVAGDVYVTGQTYSTDFPTTMGAFRVTLGGSSNAFVTKLSPSGSGLVYSTYLGGRSYDGSRAIAVDADGNAYVTGFTTSWDFPTTAGAFQADHNSCRDDEMDLNDDVFVVKLDPTGSGLIYSTYLGGAERDIGTSIAVDGAGDAYITGFTGGWSNSCFFPFFPVTPGAFDMTRNGFSDAFVTKITDIAPPVLLPPLPPLQSVTPLIPLPLGR